MPNRRRGDPVDQIQLEIDAALDPAEMADHQTPERRRVQLNQPAAWGLALLLVVLGALFGASIGSSDDGRGEAPAAPLTPLSQITTTAAAIGSPPRAVTTVPGRSLQDPTVSLLAGAGELQGHVVVAPFPDGTLWVIGGGRLASRRDVPLQPGDFPYPLVSSDASIAFADLESIFMVDASLATAPVIVGAGSFLVPGATPDTAWVIGESSAWVAALDLATGSMSATIDVRTMIGWPLAGVADGLFVRPVGEALYGPVAYWSPAGGLSPLPPEVADLHLLTGSGDLGVFGEPEGGHVTVFDIRQGVQVAKFPTTYAFNLGVRACLSPNRDLLAIVLPGGDGSIYDIRTGMSVGAFRADGPVRTVGWTAPGQLVYTTLSETGSVVRLVSLVEPVGNRDLAVASLSWTNGWFTGSAATC